jgi:hypothetical protein
MPTNTPRFDLLKPDVQPDDEWGVDANINYDKLDAAAKQADLLTVSGHLQEEIDAAALSGDIANALVGSDGVTVTSGDPTDTISGFRGEFVASSGSLQTQITTNVGDIADNTTLIVTTSGYLQNQIDPILASGVFAVNDITGLVLITGTQNVSTQTSGQTITVTGPDLTVYATTASVDSDIAAVSGTLSSDIDDNTTLITTTSGFLQDQIDVIDPGPGVILGAGGNTVISGSNQVTVSGFRDEFVAASGSLQTGIDDVGIELVAVSGSLQSDIDSAALTVKTSDDSPTVSGVNIIVVTTGTLIDDGNGQVTIATGGGTTTQSYLHVQSTASTEWVVEHALSTEYPAWAAYRSSGAAFIPEEVIPSGLNALRVFTDPAESGWIRITVGGGVDGPIGISGSVGPQGPDGGSFLHVQSIASGEWVVEHNLDNEYVVWSVYDANDIAIIPEKVVTSGVNALRVFLDWPEIGTVKVGTGGGGATGDQGDQGIQGIQGITGAVGPQGEAGNPENALIGDGTLTIISGSNITTLSGADTEVQPVFIQNVNNTNITLDPYAFYTYDIEEVRVKVSAGSGIYTITIGGAAVGGLDNQTFSTTASTDVATSANNVVPGDRVVLEVSDTAFSSANLEMSVKLRRQSP